MAGPYYVRSTDGSDGDSGLTWALAKATLAGALALAAAGERIWVSDNHAETQATAMTLTSAGTSAAPVEILCGNDAAQPPTALATTATISTTLGSSITFGGVAFSDGISYRAGSGATTAHIVGTSSKMWDFSNGGFTLGGTSLGHISAAALNVPHTLPQRWTNWTVTFNAAATSQIRPGGPWEWLGGSVAGTTLPTVLIGPVTSQSADLRIRGVDLSVLGSGKSLVYTGGFGSVVRFEQCKLGASVALTSGTVGTYAECIVALDNCDSGDTQVRMQRHYFEGDVYSETTIVRTGGASDGTTPLSHKMVSSANRHFYRPLYGPELVIWNNTTGSSQTATVEIVHDSVTALTDAEVWLEVEYLGTSGFPLSLFATDRAATIVATPANQTSSSVAWTTTGITNVNKQKLAVTFTPQEIGIVRCRVALAKSSYTVYVDPLVTVT